MARKFTNKVLTANRLIEGDVVYLGTNGDWVLDHDRAQILKEEEFAIKQLALANKDSGFLVSPYLANAEIRDGVPTPIHFRDSFRANGPTNYNHGKKENHNV